MKDIALSVESDIIKSLIHFVVESLSELLYGGVLIDLHALHRST